MTYSILDDIKETVDKLNAHKGEKCIYSGGWGMDDPEPAVFIDAEYSDEKDDIIIAVHCEDGHDHWGYVDQVQFMKGDQDGIRPL